MGGRKRSTQSPETGMSGVPLREGGCVFGVQPQGSTLGTAIGWPNLGQGGPVSRTTPSPSRSHVPGRTRQQASIDLRQAVSLAASCGTNLDRPKPPSGLVTTPRLAGTPAGTSGTCSHRAAAVSWVAAMHRDTAGGQLHRGRVRAGNIGRVAVASAAWHWLAALEGGGLRVHEDGEGRVSEMLPGFWPNASRGWLEGSSGTMPEGLPNLMGHGSRTAQRLSSRASKPSSQPLVPVCLFLGRQGRKWEGGHGRRRRGHPHHTTSIRRQTSRPLSGRGGAIVI